MKSPSIGFLNKIYHPNIDEASGSVCLDVINQQWSPMYDLVNIFEVFLPQLLLYPNPTDPLNAEAAAVQLKSQKQYEERVREYVRKYAGGSLHNIAPLESLEIAQVEVPDGMVIDKLSETSGCELLDLSEDAYDAAGGQTEEKEAATVAEELKE